VGKKVIRGKDRGAAESPSAPKRKIVLYGAGPFASLMTVHFNHEPSYEVVARCVDRTYLATAEKAGPPLVPFEKIEASHPPGQYEMFLAIGYKRMRDRERLYLKAKDKGYRLVNFVSKNALVHDAEALGENNVILAGCILEPFVRLGDNNILWSGSTLCHGTQVGNHNFFAAGTILGGECAVGDCCFFGFGARVAAHLSISNETLVGANSLVLQDTEPFTRYLGTPAKRMGVHADRGIEILD
jgi:UDP-N-acetylbacillosamine N-acetyltransferase